MKHVKFHLNRFLRRVRIHGGEFDTSARAMYREGVTSSLRADLRIVRGSTIERKQMSTKTTFKRVALVTVAALGFGLLSSVAPASAAVTSLVASVGPTGQTSLTVVGDTTTAGALVRLDVVTNDTNSTTLAQGLTGGATITSEITAVPTGVTAKTLDKVAMLR